MRPVRVKLMVKPAQRIAGARINPASGRVVRLGFQTDQSETLIIGADLDPCQKRGDRKSVVWGKSVSVRVDLGGRRIIKKKSAKHNSQKKIQDYTQNYTQ